MPHKNPTPNLNPLHPALWVLKQLHRGGNPEHFVNFRAIHNLTPYHDSVSGKLMHASEPTLDVFVKIKDIPKVWQESLYNQLCYQNFYSPKPANIYYAINPLIEKGHKKEHFAYYTCFYLDLDSNKNYSRDARWAQIYYWRRMGFGPSFVIGSGNGFHAYWVFTHPISKEEGEAILKRMVRLSGCREGGNTFDISRVFRLPGFANVKEWFNDKKPGCALLLPDNPPETLDSVTVTRYDPAKFLDFPPSEIDDLTRYHNEAMKLSAGDPAKYEEMVQQVLAGAAQFQKQQEQANAQTAGTAVAMQNQVNAIAGNQNLPEFQSKFNVVPEADSIKWGRGESWMKKYCKLGHTGMTQGELDALQQKHKWQDVSASELDFKVMYALARKAYTKDAVREFWLRSSNKLHRPDKEAKNANYWDASWEKAFEYVKAAYKQVADASKNGAEKIKISQHQTFFVGPENLDIILTGDIKLNEIFIDEDADVPNNRESYDVDVSYVDPSAPEGVRTQNLYMPHAAFSSIEKFKAYCSDLFCLLSGDAKHLQYLVRWLRLTHRDAKSYTFHSKIVFKDDRFVFPSFSITKDAILQHESSAVSQKIAERMPLLNSFNIKFLPQEQTVQQLKEHWDQTLHVHLPRVVASVLGFVASGALAPIFQQQLCAQWHVPTINIRGPASSAKTETVNHLCTVTGVSFGKNVYSVDSSKFALTEMIAATNYLPIVVDEFKPTETNQKELANIRQLFRRMYSGESIIKGRKDMSVRSTSIHGGLIILGEVPVERTGNIAEISRILPINSDGYHPDAPGNFERWRILAKIFWYELGPMFYQFLLKQNALDMYKEHQALMDEVIGMISDSFAGERYRIAHNLAAIWYGCRIFDRFIQSLWPEAPTIETVCNPKESLVKYLCMWSQVSGQTLRAKVLVPQLPSPDAPEGTPLPPPKEVVKVFPNNELFTVLKTYGMMIESRDKIIRELDAADVPFYHENDKKEQLYIPFTVMYNAVSQFMKNHGKVMPDESRLLTVLRYAKINPDDIWMVEPSKTVNVRNKHFRAVIFDVRVLRSMGVWPSKALLQDQPTHTAPTAEPETQIETPESDAA